MGEAELVARAKRGDEDAFAALVEGHQNKVYSLTLRMVGNPHDAEELAQETFLNAWRGLPNFQGGSSFSTWIYRLAFNVSVDFIRKRKRQPISMTVSLDDEENVRQVEEPARRASPEQSFEQRELGEQVRAGLAQLTETQRQILLLREMSGLSYTEISQILRIEEGTVKSRLARARLALRNVLVDSGNFSATNASEEMKH